MTFLRIADTRVRISRHFTVRLMTAVVGLAAAGLTTAACGGGTQQGGGAPGGGGPGGGMPPMPVKVASLAPTSVDDATEYVGSVKSFASAIVKPQVDGIVTRIFVRSGERVKHGAPLVQIDPARQTATVNSQDAARAAQEASVAYAKQQLARAKELFAVGANARQDLDQAQSNYDTAVAQLNSLSARVAQEKVTLQYYQVVAPSSGIVGDVPIRVGDRVTPETELTTIDQNQSLEVYVNVPLERATSLKMGLPIDVLDSEGNKLTSTTVSFISPRVDDQTQSVLVKGLIKGGDAKVRSLQFVRARLTWQKREGLVVPVVSVIRVNGQYFVYAVEEKDGKAVARQRPVKLGSIVADNYVVLGGLQPKDRIVVSGVQKLADGAPITPQA
jgi:RND family efflux transporter MFP subunit